MILQTPRQTLTFLYGPASQMVRYISANPPTPGLHPTR
jgi:hypothetical protein